ncbi:AraC family transcriptional regulator [uncultured Roseivirga sp.]|uniref:AraC family transcriptional regulator n=1 Tax=uncultured Roseivirga sp. TaxID=543088 RepID=UPI0032B28CFC|tara:strand:- start:2547 stop:3353 length:807 start_codon:yes stop_codon:yes gene_type:complete
MNYTEKLVAEKSLKDDILCYWQMKGDIDEAVGINSRYLPKGQNLLIFNYGRDIEYMEATKFMYLNPRVIIVPAFATSRIINQKGKIDLFGISFIGDGLYKLMRLPMTKLVNHLTENLRQKYENLHSELDGLDFPQKAIVAEKFLTDNINQNLNSPPLQQAIKAIHQAKGKITIGDIAKKVYVSERQLQRLFKTRIGISPKVYCKIIRVNNYIDFILSKDESVNWMELVVEYDYHDQPHLINEVKSIAKLSPKKLQSYRDTLYHRYINE